jgi:hypothetical protein
LVKTKHEKGKIQERHSMFPIRNIKQRKRVYYGHRKMDKEKRAGEQDKINKG